MESVTHALFIGAENGVYGEIASSNVNMLWLDPGQGCGFPYTLGQAGCNNV